MAGGIGGKIGKKAAKAFKNWFDDAGESAGKRAPDEDVVETEAGVVGAEISEPAETAAAVEGEAVAAQAAPTDSPETPEGPVDLVESVEEPFDPATGTEPQPELTDDQIIEDAIELGSEGELGPITTEQLQGRTDRRNINLNFFNDDKTKLIMEMYNKAADGFRANPKRAVQTHGMTISKSIDGLPPEEVKEKLDFLVGGKISDKWEPEDLVSIYTLMESEAEGIKDLAKEIKLSQKHGPVSQELLAEYRMRQSRFMSVHEIASVRAAEAGRMLNALQAVAKTSSGRQYYDMLAEVVADGGGEQRILNSVEGVLATPDGDLNKLSRTIKVSWDKKLANTFWEWRYNMMLSSFRTHAANIMGNTATGIYDNLVINPTKVLANNAEYASRAIVHATFGKGGMPKEARIPLSEIVSQPAELIMSMRGAFGTAARVFTGKEQGMGKIYQETGIRTGREGALGEQTSFLPKSVQIPVRALEAEDAFFKSTYYNARLNTLAKRKALAEAETADEVDTLAQQYIDAPTDEMIQEAAEFAEKLTFTNDPSYYGNLLGSLSRGIDKWRDNPLFKLVFPFVRTPTNIIGYTLENTGLNLPINLATDLKSTMQKLQDPETRADTEARLAISAGLFMYLKSYWEEGKITGAAPGNYGVYRSRAAAGWRDNAIRIGDEYYQLNRADPLGLILVTYASAYESMAVSDNPDPNTAAVLSMVRAANVLSDRSILSGLGDLERMFQSSETSIGKNTGKLLARMATSFVIPAQARDYRNMKDEYSRAMDVDSTVGGAFYDAFRKSILNAVPGWSEGLPPNTDAFGNDMVSIGGSLYRGLVPIKRGQIKQDPVVAAAVATGVPLNKPDHTIVPPGSPAGDLSIDLLALDGGKGWVYRAYQREVGRARYDAIQRVTELAVWEEALQSNSFGPDSLAYEAVQFAVSTATRLAKISFLEKLQGMKEISPKVGGEEVVGTIKLDHVVSLDTYEDVARMFRDLGVNAETKQVAKDLGLIRKSRPEQVGLPPELRLQTPDF